MASLIWIWACRWHNVKHPANQCSISSGLLHAIVLHLQNAGTRSVVDLKGTDCTSRQWTLDVFNNDVHARPILSSSPDVDDGMASFDLDKRINAVPTWISCFVDAIWLCHGLRVERIKCFCDLAKA